VGGWVGVVVLVPMWMCGCGCGCGCGCVILYIVYEQEKCRADTNTVFRVVISRKLASFTKLEFIQRNI
jgi:hypothetical protein